MAIPIEEWYYEVPVITRTYATAAVLISLAVQVGFVTPFQLYLNFDQTFNGRQILLILWKNNRVRYSRMLEEGSFRGRTADYFWLIFISAVALLCLSPLTNIPFLGSPLAFTLVYIWSRRNPFIRLNFIGLFVFGAPYLPWVLLGFSLLLNNVFPIGDTLGIIIGHIYYFFEDVWPHERNSGGRRWLKTPQIIVRLFEGGQTNTTDGITTENEIAFAEGVGEHGDQAIAEELAAKYNNVTQTAISKIFKNKDKYLALDSETTDLNKERNCQAAFPEIEEWFWFN
ncbi:20189_t:CDS:2 [Entrophospora sp. SA101]|nr:20189_t:CDS:2 [Entrophospora sp. SA101]